MLTAEALIQGVLAGERPQLSRAITLMESQAAVHRQLAQEIRRGILPHTGKSLRIGITGYPGAGKSSLIEVLGLNLIQAGHRVAVLAIDPSSALSQGSILGDKTRMENLSRHPAAYVRPSPSRGTLGGVTQGTQDAILLCEAAGYDLILIETVGVGQSEIQVRELVDCFVLVLLPGAGDQLQGVKRGIMEMADLLLINKADGSQIQAAKATQKEYQMALHYLQGKTPDWEVPVLTCSAQTGEGLEAIWQTIQNFQQSIQKNGYFEIQRQNQRETLFKSNLEQALLTAFYQDAGVKQLFPSISQRARTGQEAPEILIDELIQVFCQGQGPL